MERETIIGMRMRAQRLADSPCVRPEELVAWMGAVQAQDRDMARWAVGMRLQDGTLNGVRRAADEGKIIRMHMLRPTWHYVAAEDVRWMAALSARRIRSAVDSLVRSHRQDISGRMFARCNDLIARTLEGGRHRTKAEIAEELGRAGIAATPLHVTYYLMRAETDGVVCSGPDRDGKSTYALLDERVPRMPLLSREEALARLAEVYFRSHAPASLADFLWWSGLSLTEAREAVALLGDSLVRERSAGREWLVHDSCRGGGLSGGGVLLLPAYDQYLIGYKDRSDVLDDCYRARAFNAWGIFRPVVLVGGRVAGNWTREVKGGRLRIGTSFFGEAVPDPVSEGEAVERCLSFWQG
ncbi:winged helix DNA-binding domain-containing protein [Gallalistipes aquisgranensis]|uniref:winged helix DNA-binding domain-containing protein n=1 Tax=Gallalistipes aquisgranensis TaxID=2779358 RepID=UPI001CF92CAB|nr:winged helix DNA-binding domain-containing protein [Gallalistipes aquisgranensis]MBE5033319.1 AlkZ family DNA glycosylase [Gallalistipes aquisgranensis]